MIRSERLARVDGVRHLHTDRSDGPVGGPTLPGVAGVRDRLRHAVGACALAVPQQVHGAAVRAVQGDHDLVAPATDALVTAAEGVALLVQGADCPLVGFADPRSGVVGAVHSGWRGTVLRVADRAIGAAAALGARPRDLVAAVFPGIGPCCFEVGPEVHAAFREEFGPDSDRWFAPGAHGTDREQLDLRAAIVATLIGSGVAPGAIDVVPGCTACDGRLWSHRASRGGPERHGLVIARVTP